MQQQSNDVEEVLEIENFADANGNGTNKEKENGKEKEMDDIASVNDEENNSDDIETILRKKLDAELIMAKRKKVLYQFGQMFASVQTEFNVHFFQLVPIHDDSLCTCLWSAKVYCTYTLQALHSPSTNFTNNL